MEFKQKRERKLADSSARTAGVAMVADAQSALTPFGTYQYGGSPLQAKKPSAAPAMGLADPRRLVKRNQTGLPDQLKTGIESLSGMSMDSVKVHYNSTKPAQLSALAYAQGSNIHLAPGQEQHLSHEAWHLVQQAKGRGE
jgi:hypothetical protein